MKIIKDNQQFYQEIQSLSNELCALGYKNYDVLITDALSASTIPGEIYGNLRNVLDSLGQETIDYNIREKVKSLICYIDSILGPRNNLKF